MMKKASIKNIFKKDKSPRTPTEEVWGELCTSKTAPLEYTSNSSSRLNTKKSPRSPKQRSPGQQLTPRSTSSRKLDGSNSSREGVKNRRVSESNVQRLPSSKQPNGIRSASEHNLPRSSSQRISRSSTSSRNMSRHSTSSNNKRFPLQNYKYISASAVDVDAPIEDYAGPIDCDEVSLSSDGTTESIHESSSAADVVDATKEELSPGRHHDNSPEAIPVVYEDCYESDSWSANLRSSLPDDVSNTSLGTHPLTMRYTNDETMNVPREEEEDTVYSFKAVRSEEESIMAPMSIDEIDDKDAGFGRMETDESALDDEDYYRQDYFSMMTKSKRLMYEESESITEEEEAVTSLSERVLMSGEDGDGAGKQFSLRELADMTEPDLPVEMREGKDDEGVDYGNLYTDASFPLASGEEDDNAEIIPVTIPSGTGDGCVVSDEVDNTCDSETREAVDHLNGNIKTGRDVKETDLGIENVADPQDRSDESATTSPLLPDDSEFAGESCSSAAFGESAATAVVTALISDPLLTEDAANEEKSDGSQVSHDIGNVVFEEECFVDGKEQELAVAQTETDNNSGDSINNLENESKGNSVANDREQEFESAISNDSHEEAEAHGQLGMEEIKTEIDQPEQPEPISEADVVEWNGLDNSVKSAPSMREIAVSVGNRDVGNVEQNNLEDQVLPSIDDNTCQNEAALDEIISEVDIIAPTKVVGSPCDQSPRSSVTENENTDSMEKENSPIAGVKNLFKHVGLFVRKSSMTPLEEEINEIEHLSQVTEVNLPDPAVVKSQSARYCDNSAHEPRESNAVPNDTTEMDDGQPMQHARSRSLSPSPRGEKHSSIEKPFAIERTQSLPVRWHPFPISSPHIASRQLLDGSMVSIDGNCSDVECCKATLSSANTALSEPSHSDTAVDINTIIRENQRLRVKRQQLCDSLASMAAQCQVHENASSEKIFSLEQKVRALIAEKESSVAVDRTGCYGAETVRRLSVGVLEQNALLETKDKQISQLTMKLQVLQQTLDQVESHHVAAKHNWDQERLKFHSCLTSSEQKSLHALKQELFETRAQLNAALCDIDALTSALESNNEALDSTVEELEVLREFKATHSNGEKVGAQVISRAVPTLSLSPRASETSKLQRDLEQGLQELKKLHELVVTSDGKNYRDLEAEIQLLRGEANASRLEAKLANRRIKQLSDEVKDKTAELARMRPDIDTPAAASRKKVEDDIKSENVKPLSDSDWSNDLKHFSIVSDLEMKIVELESKLASFENATAVEKETVADKSKDSDADEDNVNRNSPTNTPSEDQNMTSETPHSKESPSKRAPPESPLTARKLFQPLRRGWANASPLIKNPLVGPSDREDPTNEVLKANTEVMDKLKKDIIKLQTEKDNSELQLTTKINELREENAAYASRVAVLEKAFREMNDKRASDGDELNEDGPAAAAVAEPLSPSVHSEKSDASFGHDLDLRTKNMTLQRSITELESTQSHQEDEIERLKSELVKVRVTSQQEKEAELEKLREEVAIVTAQRSALESQLIEINQSAGLLRDSLSDQSAQSPGKKASVRASDEPCSPRSTEDEGSAGGNDPILVAQVVMLENANKVLEKNVNSLRSDLQSKFTPLLEKVAMLEEEKRMMEDEMNVKLECREMTIKNLEHSLQQLNASRFGSGKKKRQSRLDSPSPTPS